MSENTYTAPETPQTREEQYYDAILRGLNGDTPAPEIPVPVWRTEEYLAAIAQAAQSGGSSLPSVSATDNGKVLAVKNGAWAADSNAFIVTMSGNTCSHSSAEIKAVVDSGRPVFAFDANGTFFALTQSADNTATFASILGVSNTIQKRTVSPQKTVTSYNSAFVPGVSVSENGFELVGKNGAWEKQAKKFIVTLTPTALDYSGTMDKTANEITAAYEAGQEIVFNVVGFPGFDHVYIPAAWCTYATDSPRCAACATLVEVGSDVQIIIVTSDADGGTIYNTHIYTTTPAS